MNELDSTTRVLNTFEGKPLDRLPVFDIIHNAEFIECVSGEKLTPQNAEDLACRAVRQTLDLCRHFAIPDNLEPREEVDDEGFVYHVEWWTKGIARRPFHNLQEAADLVKRDIEAIYKSLDRQKFCHQARGKGFVAIRDHPQTRACLCHVAKREAVRVRDRQHALVSFEGLQLLDKALQGLARGGPTARHAAVPDRRHRADETLRGIERQSRHFGGALVDVGVRVGLVRHHQRGMSGHALRDVPMQVQLDANGHVRAHDRARTLEQVAFAVQAVLGRHRTVQHQHHGLHRQRGTQVVQQLVAQLLVHRLPDGPERYGGCEQAFGDFPSP
jgi:hypothetical protein